MLQNSPTLRKITRSFNNFFFVFLFVAHAYSQADQSNVRFTQGEVNESATLSLSVPIASYKGRGIDLPISLTYSSTVWSIEHLGRSRRAAFRRVSRRRSLQELCSRLEEQPRSADDRVSEIRRHVQYKGKPSTVPGAGGCYGNRSREF